MSKGSGLARAIVYVRLDLDDGRVDRCTGVQGHPPATTAVLYGTVANGRGCMAKVLAKTIGKIGRPGKAAGIRD